MSAKIRPALVGWLIAVSVASGQAPDSDSLLAPARAAEAASQFDKALEIYVRIYLAGDRDPAIREKIHDCHRQSAQSRRHRDAAYRDYVSVLPPAEALNLYAEVLEKLGTHYAEREKSRVDRLFAHSLRELERALGSPVFRKNYLQELDDTRLSILASLVRNLSSHTPDTPAAARIALQELILAARQESGVSHATPLILEAVSGACAGLDEGTGYLPPPLLREKSSEPTVAKAEIVDAMTGVGLIAISRIRDTTPREFEQAVQRLRMEGLRSLVIDLRGNHGGSFPAAIALAERLVPSGVLAATTGQIPEFAARIYSSNSGMAAYDFPVVVLIDGKTMSAAEVLAAALKENQRATLIGMSTFGKGTVQASLPLDSADEIDYPRKPKSGLLMTTIARIVQPNGIPLNETGVTPHVKESDPAVQMHLAIQRASVVD